MFEKNALEYLISLKDVEVIEVDGHTYGTKHLELVKEPKPAHLKTRTLSALVDYLKSGIDFWSSTSKLLIHVVSPEQVTLYSELRHDKEREAYMICEALLPKVVLNNFLETEKFNIMLQSSFVDNIDRKKLLKVTGNITDKAVKEVGDDGVSQAVTIKTGVAAVNDVLVPNPVILAPFRTFPEVEQPESAFIFRMQSGPEAAIFEADGGAWRNQAMLRIKEYLVEALADMEFVKVIS